MRGIWEKELGEVRLEGALYATDENNETQPKGCDY
jgi:hypothetical protein